MTNSYIHSIRFINAYNYLNEYILNSEDKTKALQDINHIITVITTEHSLGELNESTHSSRIKTWSSAYSLS